MARPSKRSSRGLRCGWRWPWRRASSAGAARAEVIELLDKTKMNGKIIHYYDGVYTDRGQRPDDEAAQGQDPIDLLPAPAGARRVLDAREDVRALAQGADRGRDRARRSTATRSSTRGCSPSRWGSARPRAASRRCRRRSRGRSSRSRARPRRVTSATLKVLRQKGDESDTGEIAFVRENGEWKMLPPQ